MHEIWERFNGLVVKRELHIDSDSNSFTEKAYTLRSSIGLVRCPSLAVAR